MFSRRTAFNMKIPYKANAADKQEKTQEVMVSPEAVGPAENSRFLIGKYTPQNFSSRLLY